MTFNILELLNVLREAFDAGREYGWEEAKADEHGVKVGKTPEEAFYAALNEIGKD